MKSNADYKVKSETNKTEQHSGKGRGSHSYT